MRKPERTYAEDMEIDRDHLDDEWCEQPQRFMKYCDLADNAHAEVNELKERMDITMAGLDASIRQDPERYGLTKISELGVQNAIMRTQRWKDLAKELRLAQGRFGHLLSAVRAMEQRKSALEHLVKLHGMGYFSDPRAPSSSGPGDAKDYIKDRAFSRLRGDDHRDG